MSENELISIAMTTYNGEKYLREQLDSIFNQTYKNIEVIVTDDCSTDTTVRILEEYSKKYNLKYYINEENLGFIKNFEKAISLCNGEYIALSDQDDIWLPEKIQTLYDEIEDNLLIASNARLINENNVLIKESYRDYNYTLHSRKDFKHIMLFTNCIQGSTAFFRKDLIKKAMPFPDNVFHDWWLGYCAANEDRLKYINKSLIDYRIHRYNTSELQFKSVLKKTAALFFNKKVRNIYKKDCLQKMGIMEAILNNLQTDSRTKKLVQEIYWYNYFLLHFEFSKKYFNSLIFEWENRKILSQKPLFIIFSWVKRLIFLINNN